MDHIIVWSSDWPEIVCNDADTAFACMADYLEYEDGTLSAATFTDRWGQRPEDNWSIVIKPKDSE